MFDVNYLAVFLAAVANMVIGALWYSPILFCRPWMELLGIDKKSKKQVAKMKEGAMLSYGAAFLGAFVAAYVLALVFRWLGVEDGQTGIIVAMLLWLGFTAVPSMTSALFEKKPKKLWAIDEGYFLVSSIATAVILVYFAS